LHLFNDENAQQQHAGGLLVAPELLLMPAVGHQGSLK